MAASVPPWQEIDRIARAHVAAESPPEVWPFELPSREKLTASPKKVFPHYFTPFPLSVENAPSDKDHYARHYLSPDGEGGKFRAAGGYLRQRPLPVGPHDSPWWRQINLAIEIHRARAIGQDGFAADILALDSTLPRWHGPWDAYQMLLDTAAAVAPDFSILIMPDMNAGLKRQPERIVELITRLASHPAVWRLADGRVVVSNFAANKQPPEYWRDAFRKLGEQGIQTAFFPVFLGLHELDKHGREYGPFSYGLSDWGLRDVAAAESADLRNIAKRASGYAPHWMMPVAPQDFRPKNLMLWESENTAAFRWLWEAAITGGSHYVQLITWNDYGEGTEIAPSTGTQFLFYDLSAYYTAWFKLGHPPRITKDAIYYCHRVQTVPLREGPDPAKQPKKFECRGKTPLKNDVELLAMLTAPAVLEITQGNDVVRAEAPAGLASLKAPARPGRPVFRIVRDGQTVVEQTSKWTITDQAEYENLLYYGGSSTRP